MKFIQKIYLIIFSLLCFVLYINFTIPNLQIKSNFLPTPQLNNKKFNRNKYPIDCSLIIQNDSSEIEKSLRFLKILNITSNLIPDSNFLIPKENCNEFKNQRNYSRFDNYVHQIEYDFPLAFSILTYENVEQFERLLHSIYRPQNIYCIHVDLKSSLSFKRSIQAIADCFNNVFISTKLEFIIYAGFSRLQADLNCIKDLLELEELINNEHPNLKNKKIVDWKYLFNMASTEFPLKTNLEFVQILKMLNGSNSIYINKIHGQIGHRMKKLFFNDFINERIYPIKKAYNKKPPHSIRIVKGSAYGMYERNFLANIFTNEKVMNFIEWLKLTYSPDEFFWASLELNTHLYENSSFKDSKRNYIYDVARFNGWYNSYNCGGKWIHKICIFSLRDLNYITKKINFIANKFKIDFDPLSYQCMEEWLERRVIEKFYEKNNTTTFLNEYCSLFKIRSKSVNC